MNPLNTYKAQIGDCSVQTQYMELAIRSMQTEFKDEIENDLKFREFSDKYRLTLTTYDSRIVLSGISKNYLLNAYTYFDDFLKEIIKLQRKYCIGYESDRKDSESNLHCVIRNMKTTISDKDISSLIDLCEYYRLIRNDAAHITSLQDKINTCYEKIKNYEYHKNAKFGRLNAPNYRSEITFDDFVMFVRASLRLAEYVYSNLKYDKFKIAENIPHNVIDSLRRSSNSRDRCRKKLKKYMEDNFNNDVCLEENDYSEMLEIILRK